MGKRVMEVPGKRSRGRLRRRRLDNIRNDLSERELSGEYLVESERETQEIKSLSSKL